MDTSKLYKLLSTFILLGIFNSAGAISWSDWERKNAIARKGDFLVIRQPGENFCYIKQSYNDELDKLELSMKEDNQPFLLVPFFHGLTGDVSYRIDDGPIELIPVKATTNPIILPKSIVPNLKKGNVLVVKVKPVGHHTIEQHISLRGFTAAASLLSSSQCKQ